MRRIVFLSAGWVLMLIGLCCSVLPVPFPVGVFPFFAGLALLVTHSKRTRRMVQHARHRSDLLSRTLDFFVHRAPMRIKVIMRRTLPHAVARLARMRAGQSKD